MEIARKLSDEELTRYLKSSRNSEEGIKSIYREYFEGLSRFIMNNSGSRQDAEDIFQEVVLSFIDAVRKDKFRGESSVKTFLYSLNRHLWLNELKRKGRADKRELKYEHEQDRTEMDVSHFIAGREAKAQILQLVGRLGEMCKKILLMFYYEDLSMKEIVEQTDYENEQVVRNKKYKCLKQLEEMISADPLLKQTLKNII